jgi:hypothetical protein
MGLGDHVDGDGDHGLTEATGGLGQVGVHLDLM